MKENPLRTAYATLIRAKLAEKHGDKDEAKALWAISNEEYRKICNRKDLPNEQIRERAHIGLVRTTYKSKGLKEAEKLLDALAEGKKINERTQMELKVYLGIKL